MGDTQKLLLNMLSIVVIGGVLIRLLFIEVVVVDHNGMAPTLVYGEEVLVWKGASADMANVMVCEHPSRAGEPVIGRVIAFAGHTVSTDRNGKLSVDEMSATTQPIGDRDFYDVTRKKLFHMELREIDYAGHHDHQYLVDKRSTQQLVPYHRVERGVYLLGDNRYEHLFDSRKFGDVDAERCLGQVFLRWKAAPSRDDDIDNGALEMIR